MFFLCLQELPGLDPWGTALLSLCLLCIIFNTYPVLFAIERGNTDIIAGVLIAAFLRAIKKELPLWSGAFIALAINIKVYPAILLPIFLSRFGLLKTLVVTVLTGGGFFVLGPTPLKGFHQSVLRLQNYPGAWQGNHSLKSWAHWQLGYFFNFSPETISQVQVLLIVVYLTFLAYLLIRFKGIRKGRCFEGALLGMAFPLMSLIPGTSHDYRLPIYLIPLIYSLGAQHETEGSCVFWRGSLILVSACVAMLFGPVSSPVSNTEVILFLFGLFAVQAAVATFQFERKRESIVFADSPTVHHL